MKGICPKSLLTGWLLIPCNWVKNIFFRLFAGKPFPLSDSTCWSDYKTSLYLAASSSMNALNSGESARSRLFSSAGLDISIFTSHPWS